MTFDPHEAQGPFDCPHCGAGWSTYVGDAIYIDDVSDKSETTCGSCSGKFQLRCKSADVEMEVLVNGEVVP